MKTGKKQASLYAHLVRALTHKDFLKTAKFSKRAMLNFIGEENIEVMAKNMEEVCQFHLENHNKGLDKDALKNERIQISQVEAILADSLSFMKMQPEEGWGAYAYGYILHKLFEHMEFNSREEQFSLGRQFFMATLRAVKNWEAERYSFDPLYDFKFLTEEEMQLQEVTSEYKRLMKVVDDYYLCEFMRIGSNLSPFDTLGHIGGVHYIAMMVASQLKKAGVTVDLGLVSASAFSHDIGKYGCRKNEEKRVPYLHYYYTDLWLSSLELNGISHIASNHSTWDLELENLSAEALILIYADFRVKSKMEAKGEKVYFYSLDQSYDVILSKLDNVDEAKKLRYQKVYAKLKDFEEFMVEKGVDTRIPKDFLAYETNEVVEKVRDVALLDGDIIAQQFKFRAIEQSLKLMSSFHPEREYSAIIESARTENKWKNLRTYISIFSEYSRYMTNQQKIMTIDFLYEMLMYKEGEIREQAAAAMGRIVATSCEEFKKEIPEGMLEGSQISDIKNLFKKQLYAILWPNVRYTAEHRMRISSCLGNYMDAALEASWPQLREELCEELILIYEQDLFVPNRRSGRKKDFSQRQKKDMVITKLKGAIDLQCSLCSNHLKDAILGFIERHRHSKDKDVALAAILAQGRFLQAVESPMYYEALLSQIGMATTLPDEKNNLIQVENYLGTMFLDNLKAGTHWATKLTNIRLMVGYADQVQGGPYILHIATHLSNLIKVSEIIRVRERAGQGLLRISKYLKAEQINEIAVELKNGLEVGDFQFSKYIPEYLGQLLLCLPDREKDEFVDDMEKIIGSGSDKAVLSALDTVGVMASHYGNKSMKEDDLKRRNRLVNLLMKGFASYKNSISQEAFWVVGKSIFGSGILTLEEKGQIFARFAKKILIILGEQQETPLSFFNNAAVLNRVYKFMGEHALAVGNFTFSRNKKVAFFPGTFDPFSLGHKAIATTIRNMGFDVYLALDEFSWSKKTQPRLLRRKLMLMSVASEDDIYLFPEDLPVNIANPNDLMNLQKAFEGREIYMVVGSDVVDNASCYSAKPVDGSIHHMNHIIFKRQLSKEGQIVKVEGEPYYGIDGKQIQLSLPKYYEDISSTRIRENIDSGRDISNLIDSVCQNYIYDKNLYLREPEYKHVIQAKDMHITDYDYFSEEAVKSIETALQSDGSNVAEITKHLTESNVKGVMVTIGHKGQQTLGFASSYRIGTDQLMSNLMDIELAEIVRNASNGRIAAISSIYTGKSKALINMPQILIAQLLSELRARDYAYAVYKPFEEVGDHNKIIDALKKQGFVNIAPAGKKPLYAVDMKKPVILFKDVEKALKAPFDTNPHVIRTMEMCHNRLLALLNDIYKGKLIISYNTGGLYNKIMERVAKLNGVSVTQNNKGPKGPYMSVPFGDVLTGAVVPNTVTKTLHTEKYFNEDMSGFTIGHRHNYSTLENQSRTIRSFNRPVILIDDLLHKGYRLGKLMPVLEGQNVEIKGVVTGVLTGKGKDLMRQAGVHVESAYYLPSIDIWLNERDCYPFIGGDSIKSGDGQVGNINMILPYAKCAFIGYGDHKSIQRYSMVCLENTYDILRTLESEYQKQYGRRLTVRRLGQVLTNPKVPQLDDGVSYDENITPSHYIEQAMIRLRRLAGKGGGL